MPWINGKINDEGIGDFHSFHDGAGEVFEHRTCMICGLEVPVDEPMYSSQQGRKGSGCPPSTSGGGGHGRCILTAVRMCPHLVELEEVVVYRWDGPGSILAPPSPDDGWLHGDFDPLVAGVVPLSVTEFLDELRASRRRGRGR